MKLKKGDKAKCIITFHPWFSTGEIIEFSHYGLTDELPYFINANNILAMIFEDDVEVIKNLQLEFDL